MIVVRPIAHDDRVGSATSTRTPTSTPSASTGLTPLGPGEFKTVKTYAGIGAAAGAIGGVGTVEVVADTPPPTTISHRIPCSTRFAGALPRARFTEPRGFASGLCMSAINSPRSDRWSVRPTAMGKVESMGPNVGEHPGGGSTVTSRPVPS